MSQEAGSPMETLMSELELLEGMSEADMLYVLAHNEPEAIDTTDLHLSTNDILAIKMRAAILLRANYPTLDGGGAVCQAAQERLAIRDNLMTADGVVFDESTRVVQGVVDGAGNTMEDVLRNAGRELH